MRIRFLSGLLLAAWLSGAFSAPAAESAAGGKSGTNGIPGWNALPAGAKLPAVQPMPAKTDDKPSIPAAEAKKAVDEAIEDAKVKIRTAEHSGAFAIADATGEGDNAVRKLAFQFYLENPKQPLKLARTTREEALKQLQTGKADLALIEFRGKALPDVPGCRVRPYAAGALVFYVNAGNFTRHLTREQAIAVLTGERPDWKEFDKRRVDIHRVRLRTESPCGNLPERMLLANGQTAAKTIFDVRKMGEMLLLLQANPNAMGIGSFVPERPLTVQMLAYEGVVPSEENIRSGEYPLAFRRAAVYRKDNASPLLQQWERAFDTANFSDLLTDDVLLTVR